MQLYIIFTVNPHSLKENAQFDYMMRNRQLLGSASSWRPPNCQLSGEQNNVRVSEIFSQVFYLLGMVSKERRCAEWFSYPTPLLTLQPSFWAEAGGSGFACPFLGGMPGTRSISPQARTMTAACIVNCTCIHGSPLPESLQLAEVSPAGCFSTYEIKLGPSCARREKSHRLRASGFTDTYLSYFELL